MYDTTRKKSQKIQDALHEFGVCVGQKTTDKKVSGLKVDPGIGLDAETLVFETLADDIRQGMFKVLFMGGFRNGKSTMINAIIRKRAVPVKPTEVVTILLYGKNQNTVTIHYTDDTRAPEVISVDAFFEKYQITRQDEDELQIAEVKCAIVTCEHPLVEKGVRIIDSPGLSDSMQADNTTKHFVPSANAVIFLLNATKLFSAKEREYIKIHFAGKQLENVFFVINRINQIEEPEEVENVKDTTEHILHPVFTDVQGLFNRALFERRVFYVDAYHAFKSKQNGENVPPETGMPAFERELENFLSSEDKIIATFQSTLSAMANTYKHAVHTVESNIKARDLPLSELEQNYGVSIQRLDEVERSIHRIEQLFILTSKIVQTKIIADLLPSAWWEAEVVNNPDWKKFGKALKSQMVFRIVMQLELRENRDNLADNIIEDIKDYWEPLINFWGTRVETIISDDMEVLQNNLNEQIKTFSRELTMIKNILTGTVTQPELDDSSIDAVQVLVSTILGDPGLMIEGIAGSKKCWGEFIKERSINLVICLLILAVLPVVHTLRSTGQRKIILEDFFQEDILSKLAVRDNSDAFDAMKARINRFFDDEAKRLISKEKQIISDVREHQRALILQLKRNIENENNRELENLSKMFDLINIVYTQLYNRTVSIADIARIASKW